MNGAGDKDRQGLGQKTGLVDADLGHKEVVPVSVDAPPDVASGDPNVLGAVVAGAEDVRSKATREAREGRDLNGFEGVLGAELLASGGAELQYVARFFDRFAEQMGLTESPFFRHQPCLEHFRRSFQEFQVYLERQIAQIEELRERAIAFNEFSNDWQSLMKEAAYYAFFVHYGATRSGETGASGKPRDYIYHPIRAAFKVMGKRLWYLAEPEFVAEIAHDTREDVHKGMLAVLMADERALSTFAAGSDTKDLHKFTREAKKSRKPEALGLLDEMESHLGSKAFASGEKDLTVTELIALLTKKSDNRSRSFLQLIAEILKYDKSGRLFEAAVALDILKACDRFDNSVSLSPGISSGQIKNETAYLFLARAIALEAWNEVDWWHDYLMKVDPAARKVLSDLIRQQPVRRVRGAKRGRPDASSLADSDSRQPDLKPESPATLKDEFRTEFRDALRVASSRQDLVEGRDYVLEFREIGMRYEDLEKARAKASKGHLAKTFRNYVIFYPARTDRGLCEAAAHVFQQLCPDDLLREQSKSPLLTTDLGKLIVANRCGVPLVANGRSKKYGVVIWGIMKHQRDAITKFHGDYHLGKFDLGNPEAQGKARERVEDFYREVAPEVAHLQTQYALVERFGAGVAEDAEPKHVGVWTRLALALVKVGKSIGKSFGGGDANEEFLKKLKVGSLQPDDAEVIRFVLDRQVLLLFMYKEERKLTLNGMEVTGLVPREVTDEQALCFMAPVACLGRRIKKIRDGVFEIETGPFSEATCHRQADFITNMLANYRRELLADESGAWRNESVRRGKR